MLDHNAPPQTRPTVTCVIPTHGRPADLATALSSVLAQTLRPDAVLVVDDLGDHGTQAVVAEAVRSGLDVRHVEHLSGTGASSSRNRGVREATTDYVAFLDDDDRWRAAFLERTVAQARRTGAEMVLAGIERFRLDGRTQAIVAPTTPTPEQLMDRNPGVTGTNLLVHREAFARSPGFDERMRVYNDWDMLLCCLDAGLRHAVVPELLVEWREHCGERLSTLSLSRADGVEAFLRKHRHRMTARQQRELQAVVEGIRRRTSPSLRGRLSASWRLVQVRAGRRTVPAAPGRRTAATAPARVVVPQSRDGLGGSVITGALLARDLRARGGWDAVAVVNGEGPVAEHHRQLGLPVSLLDDFGRSAHRPRLEDGNRVQRAGKRVRIALRAERYLRHHPVDLVHVHDESSALGWGLAARRRSVPVVWHVHQQRPQRIDPLLLWLCAHVVFVADANRVRFGATALGRPSTTVPNTVDITVFAPAPRTATNGPVRLGFVSNLVSRKRPDWVVRAGARLLQEGYDVEVVVAGADFSGTAVDELTSSAAGRVLGERLRCPGRSDDVPAVLNDLDVLLLPSMRDREALPRIVVEAMACGLPVVATSVAGVPEAVVDGTTGRLVDPDDFDGFCSAVREVVADRELRVRMGLAGRARALEVFAAGRSVAQVEEIYRGLVRDQT